MAWLQILLKKIKTTEKNMKNFAHSKIKQNKFKLSLKLKHHGKTKNNIEIWLDQALKLGPHLVSKCV